MGRRTLGKGETKHQFYNSGGKHITRFDGIKLKVCALWENIRVRCQLLPEMDESRFGKYADVKVCEEWLDYQNFAEWAYNVDYFERGWQLDKDLLSNENIYSPDTCVFLPVEINNILNTKTRKRGELPMGLSWQTPKKRVINVQFVCKYPQFTVREYLEPSQIEEGFQIYKKAREAYVQFLAEKYKDRLDPRAYKALKEYEVNIDD